MFKSIKICFIFTFEIVVFQVERTHANFNLGQVDEYYTENNWFIASQGDGYGKILVYSYDIQERLKILLSVAMYSDKLAGFETNDNDLVSHGVQNVWICEVGSKEIHGSFENFKAMVLTSSVRKFEVTLSIYNRQYFQHRLKWHTHMKIALLNACWIMNV